MNIYFKEAESCLLKANSEINRIIDKSKGEDISYYNPTAMDKIIDLVIKAKTLIGMGVVSK